MRSMVRWASALFSFTYVVVSQFSHSYGWFSPQDTHRVRRLRIATKNKANTVNAVVYLGSIANVLSHMMLAWVWWACRRERITVVPKHKRRKKKNTKNLSVLNINDAGCNDTLVLFQFFFPIRVYCNTMNVNSVFNKHAVTFTQSMIWFQNPYLFCFTLLHTLRP